VSPTLEGLCKRVSFFFFFSQVLFDTHPDWFKWNLLGLHRAWSEEEDREGGEGGGRDGKREGEKGEEEFCFFL
jgi:hypothetical protein